jgi:hypothetical protein
MMPIENPLRHIVILMLVVIVGVSWSQGPAVHAADSDAPVSVALSHEYANSAHDDFEDGLLDLSTWSPIGGDRSVLVEERSGELSCAGRTSMVGTQSGLDTAFSFDAGTGFEVALQMRSFEGAGGGFAVEILSTGIYYHVTLMCNEGYFGFWSCYFGGDAPAGCHEASRSPLILESIVANRLHDIRLRYDGSSHQATATVGGRIVGRLTLPLPLGQVILRLFVQSPLQADELGGRVNYALEAIALGWGGL